MRRLVVAVGVAVWCAAGAWGASAETRMIAVVLDDSSAATRGRVVGGLEAIHGRVVHRFDDLLIAEVPAGEELAAYRIPGVREVAMNAIAAGSRSRSEPTPGRAAWNAIAALGHDQGRERSRPGPTEDDALVPPMESLEEVRQAAASARSMPGGKRPRLAKDSVAPALSAPLAASDLATSEFLAGVVSVNVILVESDGSQEFSSENWSASREADVAAQIASGLEWVRTQEPQARIGFVYHVIAGRTDTRARTGYEPIRHPADPTGTTGEDLWAKDVLARFGYTSGDRFARSRALAADTRRADGTDWAVNVFVVDSLVDADGKFADGRYAYTWVGGPHLVMTYDNGAWGIGRMEMVVRHEMLHAFYAFDEYAGSGCTCAEHRGYLDGANTNCEACNPIAGACVMIANGDAMCAATRRQIGWADLDGDGLIDVVGEDPDTFLDPVPAQTCSAPVLSGLASVIAATDRNTYGGIAHPSISINHVTGIEFSADGAPWAPLASPSGAPSQQVRFSAAVNGLAPGSHLILARSVDDFGNTDFEPDQTQFVVNAPLGPFGNSMRVERSGASGVSMHWGACSGATLYRVYRRSSPTGAVTMVAETAEIAWSDPAAGSGYYEVHPVDACGDERAP